MNKTTDNSKFPDVQEIHELIYTTYRHDAYLSKDNFMVTTPGWPNQESEQPRMRQEAALF